MSVYYSESFPHFLHHHYSPYRLHPDPLPPSSKHRAQNPSPTDTNIDHPTLGSISAAIASVKRVAGFSLLVNVECQSEKEAEEAIENGADIVMLDNLVGKKLHDTARNLKAKYAGSRKFLIETSGGIVEGSLTTRVGPGMSCFCLLVLDIVEKIHLNHVVGELVSGDRLGLLLSGIRLTDWTVHFQISIFSQHRPFIRSAVLGSCSQAQAVC